MRAVLCVAFVLSILSSPAVAEPGPIGRWLMNEPVSLWDKGMSAAKEAAKKAAAGMNSTYGRAWSNAYYRWKDNEIVLWVSFNKFPEPHTHENCNRIRRAFIAGIVAEGSVFTLRETMGDKSVSGIIGFMVNDWFSHDGYSTDHRDKNLGEKLARIVFVEAILRNDKTGVVCKDRMTSPDAPSKPWKRPR